MEDCESYLGLPMVGGKSKVNTFKDLQERITKRVMAGRKNLFQRQEWRPSSKPVLKLFQFTPSVFSKSQKLYVTQLILLWQSIDGGRQRIRRKSIG